MNYWLVKSEPESYSWDDFVKQGKAVWDGVRNYTARNNLAAMQLGDQVLFYHSVEGKQVVGIAKVSHESYPDPTIPEDPRWVAVELEPVAVLPKPVTLKQIKAEPLLQNIPLIRLSRLSVVPVSPNEFEYILALGHAQ